MAIIKNGTLKPTFEETFDRRIHTIEWFTPSGEWKRIWDTIYPYNDAEILDDTLDCGGFQFVTEEQPYPDEEIKQLKQLTPIRILWDSADDFETEDHSTAFDKDLEPQINGEKPVKNPIWRYRVVDEINFHQTGRVFKFTVKTLEPTKLLELETCDTMTFTNKLGHDYVYGTEEAHPAIKREDGKEITKRMYCEYKNSNRYFTKIIRGKEYNLPDIGFYIDLTLTQPHTESGPFVLRITAPDGSFEEYRGKSGDAVSNPLPKTYCLSQEGSYSFKYRVQFPGPIFGIFEFIVETGLSIPIKPYLTVSSCLTRIVNFGKTRREEIDAPTFRISSDVLEKYKDVRAPEFHITRATMWEALKTVAGHVHCIPRLIWNEETNRYDTVIFDELGGTEQCVLKARFKNDTVARDLNKTLDSYCGQIESYVDNLVNTRNNDQGAIVVPYAGGWISARAADGQLEVKDDTVVFRVSPKPGYRVGKLEIRYKSGSSYKEADITPYVYEAAEYDTLSNFTGPYPNSTAYALRFKQGDNIITELAHCAEPGTPSEFKKTEAIILIAEMFGITIPSGNFTDIEYRITYLPISSARIIQKKPYKSELTPYTRFYNVAGNTIESDYLGENLKGAIARIGNDTELRTYMFDHCKDIPKPGQILDGMYITKVITEISSRIFIRATLWLTKNFNQKNEYVALDSNLRYYDVSEKQSVDRHINYSEDVIIGDQPGDYEIFISMFTKNAVDIFKKVFTGDIENEQISWAYFQGHTKHYNGFVPEEPKKILMPCLSQAMGNSLVFNFSCLDNYGADYQISENEYELSGKRRIQTLVPYGNIYGEFEAMTLKFGNYSGIGDAKRDGLVRSLPEWTYTEPPVGLLDTYGDDFLISKDSRECINFTYQIHFVANRESIVIGSALGQFNPLVTDNKGRKAKCYLLDKPLNKFADFIDVTGLTEVTSNPSETSDYGIFYLPEVKNESGSSKRGIAWVIEDVYESGVADKKHAKLIIGENLDIAANLSSKPIFFNFGSVNNFASPA